MVEVVIFGAFQISRKWIPTFLKNPNTYSNLFDSAEPHLKNGLLGDTGLGALHRHLRKG